VGSEDSGMTWNKVTNYFDGNTIIEFTGYGDTLEILYALTHEEKIYKSTDSGKTWELVL
tara:strand:- start:17065 stop:17241 length:177 start_codon:yes stop_codon:yes gene_type:complete